MPIEKNIGIIPSSFYHLLANLSRVESNVDLIISQGFLKLTIQKILLLYENLERNETPLAELFPDGATCLLIVSRCANHHTPSTGSANNIIFNAPSNVLEFCISIIRKKEFAANNVCYFQAVHTLANLSEDTTRCVLAIYQSDILKLLYDDLMSCEEMGAENIIYYVKLIYNIASGIRIEAMTLQLVIFREPLYKVARLYPALLDDAKNAIWAITQSYLALQSKLGNKEDNAMHSYLTAKETLDLWEMGIDIYERMKANREDAESIALPKNINIGEEQGNLQYGSLFPTADPDRKNSFPRPGRPSTSPVLKPFGRSQDRLSFVARDSLISMSKVPTKFRAGGKRRIVNVPYKDHQKILSLDLDRLPELRITRPAVSPQNSRKCKDI